MLSLKRVKGLLEENKQILVTKLKVIKATPYAIASGFACGAAISFTPFVGFHLLLATITAFLVRGNLLASWIGTIVGNPWTFAFIWPSTLYLGRFFLHIPYDERIDFIKTFDAFFHAAVNFDFKAMEADVWPIIYPMMIGCVPFYILALFLSYFIIKRILNKIKSDKIL